MEQAKRYGVRVSKANPDPDARVEYILDAEGMKPARMDFEAGTFDYGDWADVWFVRDNYPCMVKSSGVEDYRLDPNDYCYREDGTVSDVSGVRYDGNAMSAVPTVWVKSWEDEEYQYFVVCESRYDETYQAFAHTREDGSIAAHVYFPLFEGSIQDGVMRSLKGLEPTAFTTAGEELAAARANGECWSILTWSGINLLAVLLLVMSKTDDCQAAFGAGHVVGGAGDSRPSPLFVTGKVSNRGQFFGSGEGDVAVKVFHMEHPWGDRFERFLGFVNDHAAILTKMTPPYSLDDFSAYENTGVSISGPSRMFVKASVAGDSGRIPCELAEGDGTEYQCDRLVYSDEVVGIPLLGGTVNEEAGGGIWMLNMAYPGTRAHWHQGGSLFAVEAQ